MIGLDTNVLVRCRATHRARSDGLTCGFRELHCHLRVVWVLESAYGFGRPHIVPVLRQLLATVELRIESADMVTLALRAYESDSADFAYHLVGILNQNQGCEATYTFDRKAGRLDTHRLVVEDRAELRGTVSFAPAR